MIGLFATLRVESNAEEMEDKKMKRPARILPVNHHHAYTPLPLVLVEMLNPISCEIKFLYWYQKRWCERI